MGEVLFNYVSQTRRPSWQQSYMISYLFPNFIANCYKMRARLCQRHSPFLTNISVGQIEQFFKCLYRKHSAKHPLLSRHALITVGYLALRS